MFVCVCLHACVQQGELLSEGNKTAPPCCTSVWKWWESDPFDKTAALKRVRRKQRGNKRSKRSSEGGREGDPAAVETGFRGILMRSCARAEDKGREGGRERENDGRRGRWEGKRSARINDTASPNLLSSANAPLYR